MTTRASHARSCTRCRGSCARWRAIREVVPGARLIQTEDLGKTHATRALALSGGVRERAALGTGDVLTGRLRPHDALWRWMRGGRWRRAGGAARVRRRAVPAGRRRHQPLPDERALPRSSPVALSGRTRTVATARIVTPTSRRCACSPRAPTAPSALLGEAWDALRHAARGHGGAPRLLRASSRCAGSARCGARRERLRARGVPVRAVTAWAALGSFDWSSLLTRESDHYEPGLFDVSAGTPRPTALAAMVRALATDGTCAHPALAGRGWWERRSGCCIRPSAWRPRGAERATRRRRRTAPRAHHRRARHARTRVAAACALRGLAHVALGRAELDVTDVAAVERALCAHDAVGGRELRGLRARGRCRARPGCVLARERRAARWRSREACAARGVRLATFSSDLVFGHAPAERARAGGRSDRAAERLRREQGRGGARRCWGCCPMRWWCARARSSARGTTGTS